KQPRLAARLGKLIVLREEPITRMDRLGARLARGLEDLLLIEVRLRARRLADTDRLVGLAHERSLGVRRRVHRHGLDAARAAGALDTAGDLPPIGYQQFSNRCFFHEYF